MAENNWLEGRHALITGGGTGIGAAAATHLHAAGALSGDFEKPGRRDSGSPRTSITRWTPASFKVARNSPTVVPS